MLKAKIKEKLVWLWQKAKEFLKNENKLIYLEFAFISLAIIGPLFLKTGYIFAIDMVFVPKIRFPEVVDSYYLFHIVLWLINYILPSWLIQKILLFLVPFLAGVGIYRLIPTESKWPKYFAAFLYIFNPFTYSRFLFGHLLILLTYAFVPFAFKAIFDFFNRLSWRAAARVVFWLALITFVDFHTTFFVVLFFGVYFLFFILANIRNREIIQKAFLFSLFIAFIFLVLNSFWLVPAFLQPDGVGSFINSIDSRQIEAFSSSGDSRWGVFWNTAAMYGFWGDREGNYLVQKDIAPYWFYIFLALLVIAVCGLLSTLFLNRKFQFYNKDNLAVGPPALLSLLMIWLFSWFFAVGLASQSTRLLAGWIYEHVIYFKGYREPQKFVSLLVLVYAYFGALGVNNLLFILKKIKTFAGSKIIFSFVTFFLIVLPLFYSPGLLGSFGGQLYNSYYPTSWFTVNNILNHDEGNFQTLFLPWHQYLAFSFTNGKIIGNPAENFFDRPVIAGDNIELGDIYTQSTRPESQVIEKEIIFNKDRLKNIGEKLQQLNIKYVIMTMAADYQAYQWLSDAKDLGVVYQSTELTLYLNKKWQSK